MTALNCGWTVPVNTRKLEIHHPPYSLDISLVSLAGTPQDLPHSEYCSPSIQNMYFEISDLVIAQLKN